HTARSGQSTYEAASKLPPLRVRRPVPCVLPGIGELSATILANAEIARGRVGRHHNSFDTLVCLLLGRVFLLALPPGIDSVHIGQHVVMPAPLRTPPIQEGLASRKGPVAQPELRGPYRHNSFTERGNLIGFAREPIFERLVS